MPPTGTGSVSGVLTLRSASGVAPLAHAGVGAFAVTAGGPMYPIPSVTTDADGRFEFTNVPYGHLVLTSGVPHTYQPCAAVAIVSAVSGVANFEVVDSTVTRPRSAADSPVISGIVYRSTDAGRQPIAGALIEFEYAPLIAATTMTDAQGRYALCQLPTGRGGVDVWLNGVAAGGSVVNVSGDQALDFEVR